MSKMLERLSRTFSVELSTVLVECFQRAYRASADCYDPLIGHDEMVFGLMVHKSIKHFIVTLALEEPSIPITIRSRAPRFLFEIEGFTVSAYRVGDSLDMDPAETFPNNRNGAGMLAMSNQQQMSFSFMHEGAELDDDSSCSNLIIAHSGSSEEGLQRVFVGVPSKLDESHKVVAWSSTLELWRREGGGASMAATASGGPVSPVPVEKIAPPVLSLKDVRKPEEIK